MRAAWVVIGAALVLTSGCAQKDWIDRTLVTVDVTGTWQEYSGGSGTGYRLELEQQGSVVKGFLFVRLQAAPGVGKNPIGPLEGTVAGDVFYFRKRGGGVEMEVTVNGDEMHGEVMTMYGRHRISLRRIDPSSPLASPPR